jgi:hypothetical protein
VSVGASRSEASRQNRKISCAHEVISSQKLSKRLMSVSGLLMSQGNVQ